MIIFEYKKESYVVDDDFNVFGGEYKKLFEKDIDLFLDNFTPSSGDAVAQYAERLEKMGAEVHEYKNVKYSKGTVDVSDYEED